MQTRESLYKNSGPWRVSRIKAFVQWARGGIRSRERPDTDVGAGPQAQHGMRSAAGEAKKVNRRFDSAIKQPPKHSEVAMAAKPRKYMVGRGRFELPTNWLKASCSTD